MQVERDQWITHREAAKMRLTTWGAVIRYIAYFGAPSSVPYHKQPFTVERSDLRKVRGWLELTYRSEEALETDEWVQDLRKTAPNAFHALVVRYVDRRRGGVGLLTGREQVKLFKQRTGKGERWYYYNLQEAERYIGLMAGIVKAF